MSFKMSKCFYKKKKKNILHINYYHILTDPPEPSHIIW